MPVERTFSTDDFLLSPTIQFDNNNHFNPRFETQERAPSFTMGPNSQNSLLIIVYNEMMVYVIKLVSLIENVILIREYVCLSLCIHIAFVIKCLPFTANLLSIIIQTNYLLFVNTATT